MMNVGDSIMLAFKNYLIKTSDYLEYKEDIDVLYDVVIPNAGKFVKNLDFLKSEKNISMNITYKASNDDDSIMSARYVQVTGGRLRVNWTGGERYEVRDINKGILNQRLDLKNKKWSFALSNSQFSDVKKLSNINSERIININVVDSVVSLSESSAWDLEIGEIETKSANFIFNKRFLKCINADVEEIEFNLFESFILIKDKDSNLMLSYEQDFDQEDL